MSDIAVTQHRIHLPAWDVEINVILTPEGPFYMVRELCGVLGIKDMQYQMLRLRERRSLAQFVRQWPVQTKGGRQRAWCIHRRAVGIWWGTIDESKCRVDVQDRLVQLQIEVIDAADRALHGEVLPGEPWRGDVARLDGDVANVRQLALKLEERIGRLEGIVLSEDEQP
jgi:hypothetical protein